MIADFMINTRAVIRCNITHRPCLSIAVVSDMSFNILGVLAVSPPGAHN